MRAADLTEANVGMVVLDVPGIVGWQEHLLLTRVEDCEDGTIRLDFRWNDDPSPANTRRGQFAIGQYVSPDVPVRVLPAPTHPRDTPTDDAQGGRADG